MSALFLLSIGRVCSQGTISFANSPGQEITNCNTGLKIPTGSGYVIGMYYGVAGTVDDSSLVLLATTGVAPVAGRFVGGTVTTPAATAPGGTCVIQIRAWSGGFANYDLAYAAASVDGTTVIGKSSRFNVTTGNPNPPVFTPAAPLTGLLPFQVGSFCMPEPSSVALALLGLMAVLFFRPRHARK